MLILAKRKIEAAYTEAGRPIDNVKIMSTDIERIKGVLTAQDTVSRIYINFCNPWSKNASSNKHRLTYPRQLIQYREFLKDGGEIYFKTDDDDLFRDSLEYFPASGYEITWKTFDLHENEPEWNIRTEHEGMFTEMGIKIKALIAKKLPGDAAVTWIEPKVLKKRKLRRKPLPPQRRSKMSFFVNTMVCGFSLYQILAFFPDLLLPGLVPGGHLCRRFHRPAGEPRLSERPGLPHLRLWHDHCAVHPDPSAEQRPAAVHRRCHPAQCAGTGRRLALYKLYHTRWWDYSDFPFNIGGYICLEFSLLWGVGTLVVMRIVHPVVAGLVDMVPPFVGFVVMCVLSWQSTRRRSRYGLCRLRSGQDAGWPWNSWLTVIHAVSDAMTQLLAPPP